MSEITRCAVYARYSSNNQREASIEDQIRKCRETAQSKGWEILEDHIYYDRAQSGTRMSSREGFKEMLQIAMGSECPFQKILVDDTSRIARNTREALDIFSLLTFYGVHVYYVSQGIDTSHEAAEEMITINGLIDSLYIRNLAKETHRGIEGQVLKGYSGGGRRYGYRSEPIYNGKVDIYGNPEADGYILKINADEADTIIRIFKLFSEKGYSAKKIVNLLNREIKEAGEPKPPRGKYWCVSTILGSKKALRGILNNEIYIGRYYWNRSMSKRNPESGKKKTMAKNQERWITINKPELRIISDDLWDKVKKRQRQMNDANKGKYNKARPAYSSNLITGLATCGQCGGNIVVVSGGKWGKYGCSNNWNKGASVCSNNAKIKKREIEKIIIEAVSMDFNDDGSIAYLVEKVNSIIKDRLAHNNPEWRGDTLNEQLKKTEKEINNFINAIKAGIITDTVRARLMDAEKKKLEIESILNNAKNKAPLTFIITADAIKRHIQNICSTLNIHPVHGRAFLSKIIDKVIVEPFGNMAVISIHCKKESILGDKCIVMQIQEHCAQSPRTESYDHNQAIPNNSPHHMEDNLCLT